MMLPPRPRCPRLSASLGGAVAVISVVMALVLPTQPTIVHVRLMLLCAVLLGVAFYVSDFRE